MTNRIGDIIEFKDFRFDGDTKKFVDADDVLVGRITSICHNIGKVSEFDPHEWELWLEYYGEMPGRLYVIPENVIRVIEKGDLAFNKKLRPPLSVGTKVSFDEEKKKLYDEIVGYSVHQYRDEVRFQYEMKFSKYSMEADEFEVVGSPQRTDKAAIEEKKNG